MLTGFDAVGLRIAGQRSADVLQQGTFEPRLALNAIARWSVGAHTYTDTVHVPALIGQQTRLIAAEVQCSA